VNFEVGDKIAVLDDTIKGIVVKVIGDEITIKDEDGMSYNYYPNDLVKIGIDQNELTKYSDIDHQLLKNKATEKPRKALKFATAKKEVVMEVDLHIQQLVSSMKGMDNYDMLNLQIDTAKRKLEYAIQKRIPKIVFIHGVGEGVLKTELTYLFNKYPVKFYDASYQKYGLGATEVYIFQNLK